jgi:hypothetical protein
VQRSREKSTVVRWFVKFDDQVSEVTVGRGYAIADGDLRDGDVHSITVEHDLGEIGWRIRIELSLDDAGNLGVSRMVFEPEGSAGELDGELWKRLRLGDLHQAIRTELPFVQMLLPHVWMRDFKVPRPGQKGHSIEHYALWVQRYLDACADENHGRAPMKALVEQYPGYDRKLINLWLARAEELGLLRGRAQGKAGGTMTAKCRRILDGKH